MMLDLEKERELKILSKRIQMEIMREIAALGTGHLGGSLSIADALAVLYGRHLRCDPKRPDWNGRDWLVCSKGHAGPAVYAALALKGFFPMEELATLNRPKTRLPSHCDRNLTTGVDMTTGSLGQGASAAAGVAVGHKMNGADNTVYLIMGDGEINEGQVWEMALFAAHRKLDNLIAFVDHNRLQLDGFTDDICALGDIAAKFREFGWHAQTVDGHDVRQLDSAIEEAKLTAGKPSVIVMNTVKGHGWRAVENRADNHSMTVSPAQLEEALAEMGSVLAELEGEAV